MSTSESVIARSVEALPRTRTDAAGTLLGAAGILLFSFTFPATKLALRELDPWCAAFGRAAVAALPAAGLLMARRARRPSRDEGLRLIVVVAGVVVGFPLLSALALRSSSASHGAVVVAVLPALTAVLGSLRARERPTRRFWLAAATGSTIIAAFAVSRSHGGLSEGDAELLVAVVLCAAGYAEGAGLARGLGAPETICWALVACFPVALPIAILTAPHHVPGAAATAGFLYTAFASALFGFFAWYAGLARGGVARVSQVQLAQAPLTLLWSAAVLGERITWGTALVAAGVLASVAATQRARIEQTSTPAEHPQGRSEAVDGHQTNQLKRANPARAGDAKPEVSHGVR